MLIKSQKVRLPEPPSHLQCAPFSLVFNDSLSKSVQYVPASNITKRIEIYSLRCFEHAKTSYSNASRAMACCGIAASSSVCHLSPQRMDRLAVIWALISRQWPMSRPRIKILQPVVSWAKWCKMSEANRLSQPPFVRLAFIIIKTPLSWSLLWFTPRGPMITPMKGAFQLTKNKNKKTKIQWSNEKRIEKEREDLDN